MRISVDFFAESRQVLVVSIQISTIISELGVEILDWMPSFSWNWGWLWFRSHFYHFLLFFRKCFVLVTYFPNFWYFYWRAIVNSHCIPLSVAGEHSFMLVARFCLSKPSSSQRLKSAPQIGMLRKSIGASDLHLNRTFCPREESWIWNAAKPWAAPVPSTTICGSMVRRRISIVGRRSMAVLDGVLDYHLPNSLPWKITIFKNGKPR